MRDSIICDIQQTLLGELGYVSQTVMVWSWQGKGTFSLLQNVRPALTLTPSFCSVGTGIISLWVKLGGRGVN